MTTRLTAESGISGANPQLLPARPQNIYPVRDRRVIGLARLCSDAGILTVLRPDSDTHPETNGKWGLPSCKINIGEGETVMGRMTHALTEKYGFRDLAFFGVRSYSAGVPGNQATPEASIAGFVLSVRAINPAQLINIEEIDPKVAIETSWRSIKELKAMSHQLTPHTQRALGFAGSVASGVVQVA